MGNQLSELTDLRLQVQELQQQVRDLTHELDVLRALSEVPVSPTRPRSPEPRLKMPFSTINTEESQETE